MPSLWSPPGTDLSGETFAVTVLDRSLGWHQMFGLALGILPMGVLPLLHALLPPAHAYGMTLVVLLGCLLLLMEETHTPARLDAVGLLFPGRPTFSWDEVMSLQADRTAPHLKVHMNPTVLRLRFQTTEARDRARSRMEFFRRRQGAGSPVHIPASLARVTRRERSCNR